MVPSLSLLSPVPKIIFSTLFGVGGEYAKPSFKDDSEVGVGTECSH